MIWFYTGYVHCRDAKATDRKQGHSKGVTIPVKCEGKKCWNV